MRLPAIALGWLAKCTTVADAAPRSCKIRVLPFLEVVTAREAIVLKSDHDGGVRGQMLVFCSPSTRTAGFCLIGTFTRDPDGRYYKHHTTPYIVPSHRPNVIRLAFLQKRSLNIFLFCPMESLDDRSFAPIKGL